MSTLLLNNSAILQSLEAVRLLEELRRAYLHPDRSDIPAYTVSMSSRFQNEASPASHLIGLFDLPSGALLALLEAKALLPITRSLVNALVTDIFSDNTSDSLVILGASDDARRYVKSLRLVRSLRQVNVYDNNLEAAQRLAAELFGSLSLPATAYRDMEEAVFQQNLGFVSAHTPWSPSFISHPHTHLTFQSHDVLSKLPRSEGLTVISDASGENLSAFFQPTALLKRPTAFATTLPAFVEWVAAWHVYQGAVETGAGMPWEAFE